MGVYTHTEGNWLSRRGSFLVILFAFHGLLFWALKSGFAMKIVEAIAEPIKAEIINEVKKIEPPPPPPTVKIEIPKIQVPPILVDIPNPPEPPPTVIIQETTVEKVAPPAPIPPQVVSGTGTEKSSVRTQPSYANRPDPQDFYPGASRNNNEEGVVRIRLCYDDKGKVGAQGTPALAETSKYPRLDEAGLRYGKAVRIRPGTVDGKPEAGCVVMPVRFSLKGEQ